MLENRSFDNMLGWLYDPKNNAPFQNDQHPPVDNFLITSSVLAGELLLNRVYQAVRHGKNWAKTMLIITYDEHGGCYDHVPPPTAVPPHAHAFPGEQGFTFDRLGVRVPAIIISPYTEAGKVIHTTFDHTSTIKTITKRWDLPHLTERDKHAHDLGEGLIQFFVGDGQHQLQIVAIGIFDPAYLSALIFIGFVQFNCPLLK